MKLLDLFSRNDRGIKIEIRHEPTVFERARAPADTTRSALIAAISALNALDPAHEKQMRDLVPRLAADLDDAREALLNAFRSIEGDHNCPVGPCSSVVPGPDKDVPCWIHNKASGSR